MLSPSRPYRIARVAGIGRKQVTRLLKREGITRESPRPGSAQLAVAKCWALSLLGSG